jgi:hypothetical protein
LLNLLQGNPLHFYYYISMIYRVGSECDWDALMLSCNLELLIHPDTCVNIELLIHASTSSYWSTLNHESTSIYWSILIHEVLVYVHVCICECVNVCQLPGSDGWDAFGRYGGSTWKQCIQGRRAEMLSGVTAVLPECFEYLRGAYMYFRTGIKNINDPSWYMRQHKKY